MIDYVAYMLAQQRTEELARSAHAKAAVQVTGPTGQPITAGVAWRLQLSRGLHWLANLIVPSSGGVETGPWYDPRGQRLCRDRTS